MLCIVLDYVLHGNSLCGCFPIHRTCFYQCLVLEGFEPLLLVFSIASICPFSFSFLSFYLILPSGFWLSLCRSKIPRCYSFSSNNSFRFGTRSYRRRIIFRSPRVSLTLSIHVASRIYADKFCTVSGFCLFSNITHLSTPCIRFLFVSPNVCRQLPSDSQSPATPLLLAKTSYCKASSGLSPYSC